MSRKQQKENMAIGGLTVEVHRKKMKNLRLKVVPPTGNVIVSAPHRVPKYEISTFVLSELAWIREQQEALSKQGVRPLLKYISGETHFLWGERIVLELLPTTSRQYAVMGDGVIKLFAKPTSNSSEREHVLKEFYRATIKEEIPRLLETWEPQMGVKSLDWGVKKMKTRWGTCNTRDKRIWLNLELAKHERACLEYVVVHELAHLIERNHSPRFWSIVETFIPNWRDVRERLNRASI